MSLKSIAKKLLGKKNIKKLKNVLGKDIERTPEQGFPGSERYWEQRYKKNKNSGAGSYGRLAQFKAEVLNDFVRKNEVASIIEYGSGDGNQLKLAEYPYYIGFDVSETALELCKKEFAEDPTKVFHAMDDTEQKGLRADLTMSLDVLYHLIEDEVFHNYMARLFDSADRFVIVYSSDYDKEMAAHVRSRKFTDWVELHASKNWKLKEFIKNKYPFSEELPDDTSISDFYIYERR